MNVLLFEGQDRGPREGTRWEGFLREVLLPWARQARERGASAGGGGGGLQVFLA